jgi:CRP-like cAMP-binding protein
MIWKKIRQVVEEGKDQAIAKQGQVKNALLKKFQTKALPNSFEQDDTNNNDTNNKNNNNTDGRNNTPNNNNKNAKNDRNQTTTPPSTTKTNGWREMFQRTRQEEVLGGQIWNERMRGVYDDGCHFMDDYNGEEWLSSSAESSSSSLALFVPPKYPKSQQDIELLERALVGSFIFSRLSQVEKDAILGAFEEVYLPTGSVLYAKGDRSTHLYVVKQGAVQFVGYDDKKKHPINSVKSVGSYFGELALLYDNDHSTTCTAIADDTVVWTLPRQIGKKVIAKHSIQYDNDARKLLQNVFLFQELDDSYLTLIAHSLGIITYNDGDYIVKKGEECLSFYIVQKGQVRVTDIVLGESKYNDILFNPGESLGEKIISENMPIPGNVVAVGETTLLWMHRDVFLKLFGGWSHVIRRSVDRKVLVRTFITSSVTV